MIDQSTNMMARPKLEHNPTREKILEAALRIFLEKGFAGASMSMISKEAGVNQSLIYHHFENKDKLWIAVKGDFVHRCYPLEDFDIPDSIDLKTLVERFFISRFMFYFNNPDIIRMMNWQRLDNNQQKLSGGTAASPSFIENGLKKMQALGKIRQDLDMSLISTFLAPAVTASLYDSFEKFQDDSFRKKYVDSICRLLVSALQPQRDCEL